VNPTGLLDVIGDRRQLLHDRMNSAADVGALEWCEAIMQAKGFIFELVRDSTFRWSARDAHARFPSHTRSASLWPARRCIWMGRRRTCAASVELLVAAVRAIETS
jgi:hypothetical protein